MKVDFYNTRPTPSKRFGLVPSRASANKGSYRSSLPEDRVYDTATEISRRPGNDNRRCIAHFSLLYLDRYSHSHASSPYFTVRRIGLPRSDELVASMKIRRGACFQKGIKLPSDERKFVRLIRRGSLQGRSRTFVTRLWNRHRNQAIIGRSA